MIAKRLAVLVTMIVVMFVALSIFAYQQTGIADKTTVVYAMDAANIDPVATAVAELEMITLLPDDIVENCVAVVETTKTDCSTTEELDPSLYGVLLLTAFDCTGFGCSILHVVTTNPAGCYSKSTFFLSFLTLVEWDNDIGSVKVNAGAGCGHSREYENHNCTGVYYECNGDCPDLSLLDNQTSCLYVRDNP